MGHSTLTSPSLHPHSTLTAIITERINAKLRVGDPSAQPPTCPAACSPAALSAADVASASTKRHCLYGDQAASTNAALHNMLGLAPSPARSSGAVVL
mmetsp:Transcript_68361/g.135452  ORF Transcript_68361/g.135452 Transcript_68361/m.135452 type:complete len:97 (+) Transcript_68361:172-462(+)